MSERGVIECRERARQINDFSGLRFGNITPTDIDGFIDFNNKVFIWFELKYINARTLQTGQKLALERLCDACSDAGKESWVFVAEHSVADVSLDIDSAITKVILYRHDKVWREPKAETLLKPAIERVLNMAGVNVEQKCRICQTLPTVGDGMCSLCADANAGWASTP